MISRHLLRIKTFQTIYSFRKNDCLDFDKLYKDLHFSIQKSYELYLLSIQLLVEIKHYAGLRIDQIQQRVIKDEAEWKKIIPLFENKIFEQLENNNQLTKKVNDNKISWANNQEIVKDVYKQILESDVYASYAEQESSYESDKKLVKKIYQNIILQNENFFTFLEESSIFWNDDVDQVISMASKSIHKFKASVENGGDISSIYNDVEAKDFVENLFSLTIKHWDEYNPYIEDKLQNWEQERVAEVDIILLQMAIAEAIHFKEIPVRVTLNEYIELSKLYSTEKSNVFINGVLHSIFDMLQKESKIKKVGRGLMS